ncbi:hypothetical protein BASA62_009070 [Batrachochytrium salamandrivorans]|nr:hypothetical protein BASA62_009070 [Batrachochytrium salamandrivorans]
MCENCDQPVHIANISTQSRAQIVTFSRWIALRFVDPAGTTDALSPTLDCIKLFPWRRKWLSHAQQHAKQQVVHAGAIDNEYRQC